MYTNEMAPLPIEKSHIRRPAETSLPHYVIGWGITGLFSSVFWSMITTQNSMSEFGRYQAITWHKHRWTHATGSHVSRAYFMNAFTWGGMLMSFALFDGVAETLRGQDDMVNTVIGGAGMGLWLGSIRGVYMGYVSMSIYMSGLFALKRWGMDEDICPKIQLWKNGWFFGGNMKSVVGNRWHW